MPWTVVKLFLPQCQLHHYLCQPYSHACPRLRPNFYALPFPPTGRPSLPLPPRIPGLVLSASGTYLYPLHQKWILLCVPSSLLHVGRLTGYFSHCPIRQVVTSDHRGVVVFTVFSFNSPTVPPTVAPTLSPTRPLLLLGPVPMASLGLHTSLCPFGVVVMYDTCDIALKIVNGAGQATPLAKWIGVPFDIYGM